MNPLTILLLFLSLSTSMAASKTTKTNNITKILERYDAENGDTFSTFNHYLAVTRLAAEINRRKTITVLAVNNSGMSALLDKHLSILTIRNVLSLHILTDYYGAKKLHQLTDSSTLAATVFQSSGHAPGTSGYINITDHKAGLVTFTINDPSSPSCNFVKSIVEHPYDISVLQISSVFSSPEAEAPVAALAPVNLTDVMANKGCKAFSELLLANPDVYDTYTSNLEGGLTVFCPNDAAVKAFEAKYKNLTADGKTSLLLYHGVPVYFSMQLLTSNNGVLNTLATDGKSKSFNVTVQNDGERVTLKTRIVTATIVSTAIDQDPDAVYVIDKMLQPKELFKNATADDIAPALAPVAEAPKGSKNGKGGKGETAAEPAGPDPGQYDDNEDDQSVASGFDRSWIVSTMVVSVVAGIVMGWSEEDKIFARCFVLFL